MTANEYARVADAVLLVHAAFVLFVVGGQALILCGWWRDWKWTRGILLRVAHLIAIGFVVLESWCGVACPLTVLESRLRFLAGAAPYRTSFVGEWVQRLIYYSAPPWVFTALYTAFALLVVLTFIAYPPRRNPGCKPVSNRAK